MYNSQGYVALVSAIIISALLLAITLGAGFSGLLARANILDSESKEQSSLLAEACINKAMGKLAKDSDYMLTLEDHAIGVANKKCNIVSLAPESLPRNFPITIESQACVNKAVTNLIVIIDSEFNIISFKEVPNFLSNNPCFH